MMWSGYPHGWLWWRQRPHWQGPDEARRVIDHQLKRLEAAGLVGSIDVATGEGDLGVIEFNADAPIDKDLRANLVVTMSDGKITSMQDYRRRSKARRAASVSAGH